jgi:hypothetical protein
MNMKAKCPNCGARSIALLAKAGVSSPEPVDCPECGAHLELGAVWGWVLAVAAPGLFSLLLISLLVALNALSAIVLTLLISSGLYLVLIFVAPLRVV